MWDIAPSAPQPGAAAPASPLAEAGKPNAIMGLEARPLELEADRKKRHRLQRKSPQPAIMGAMEHDALSKSLFALPLVEADLLRIVAREWVHLLDLDALERLSAEHPAADRTQRVGDLAWRAPFRAGELLDGSRPWLLQPTELQSTRDAAMGERQAEYVGRHLRALRREGVLRREGEEPRVLPVVVYNGQRRWRRDAPPPGVPLLLQPGGYVVLDAGAGALEDWPRGNRVSSWVRLQRSGGPEELLSRLAEGLREFPEALDEGFREALHAWAQALLERMMPGAGALPPRNELEQRQGALEMTTLIEANFDKWKAGLVEQGITQGRTEGIAQGMERGMERGIAQGRTEGMAQGRTEGLEQGEARARADQRAQLGRLAGRKFGGRAAERLSALIEGESDPERLAEVGDWIIDCNTEAELLARAGRRG